MKLLSLSDGSFAQVDDEDYERLNKFSWQHGKGWIFRVICIKSNKELYSDGYQKINIPLANEIMNRPNVMFDHADQDYKNNQKSNLRECNRSQNNSNTLYYNSFGFRGISKSKGSWRASISLKGKIINLGSFKTKEEAAKAYDLKAKELHGEFAVLNFPI